MKKKRFVKLSTLSVPLLLIIFIPACASDNTIRVSFDGNGCVLSGPTDLETGEHLIEVHSTSEIQGFMRICKGNKGYVWQDFLNHDFSDDEDVDEDIEWPTWCEYGPSLSVVGAESDKVIYECKLRYEGIYFVFWEQKKPGTGWHCGLLTVQEAEGE